MWCPVFEVPAAAWCEVEPLVGAALTGGVPDGAVVDGSVLDDDGPDGVVVEGAVPVGAVPVGAVPAGVVPVGVVMDEVPVPVGWMGPVLVVGTPVAAGTVVDGVEPADAVVAVVAVEPW